MNNKMLIKIFLLLLLPLGLPSMVSAGEIRVTYSDRHHSHDYDRGNHVRHSYGVSHYDKKRLRERVYADHRTHRLHNHSYNRTHRNHDGYYNGSQYRSRNNYRQHSRHDHYRYDRKRHHYARQSDLGSRRYDRKEPRYCR